ncbi:MAG: hypothetical protein JXQ27_13460 [Acidobacteria bacterium]|nr:hypothetical protein [Acidobacteriota bacterium]
MNISWQFLMKMLLWGGLLCGVAMAAPDEQKKENTAPKKSQNLQDVARSKEQPKKQPGKVYTNQDVKAAKGNIATSSLSGKTAPGDEDQSDDPLNSGEAERQLETVKDLEAALVDLDTARHMHQQAQESLAGLTDRLLAAVGDAEKLRSIRKEKALLENEAAYWADRLRQAERRLDALKKDLQAKGQPTDLIDLARERLKRTQEGEGPAKEGGKNVRAIGG